MGAVNVNQSAYYVDNGMIYQLSSDGTEYALISYADVDEIVDPTILSEINGIPVKSVRINAFNGFQHVKGTLTIPSSIETIGHFQALISRLLSLKKEALLQNCLQVLSAHVSSSRK